MRTYETYLDAIATDILNQNVEHKGTLKPNYSNRSFMNTLIIFQTALMDKMYDNQNYIEIDLGDRMKMAENCGLELRELILKYTGLDTHDIDEFL